MKKRTNILTISWVVFITLFHIFANFEQMRIHKNTWIWGLFGLSMLLFCGCVPAKKIVFFQKDDLKHRDQIPKDSIVRSHPLSIREYKIQPLDMVSIVFETLTDQNDKFDFLSKFSQLQGATGNSLSGILVNGNGEIEYPVLGKIKISGLTLFEAKDKIEAIAALYLPDVVVRVRMLNFRFTVLGEVIAEKTVTSFTPRLTMSEAIGLTGGFSEYADKSNIKIIRQNEGSTDVFYVNLLEEEFLESPNYFVQQNDVIIVPPLKQRTFKYYYVANLSIVLSTFSIFLLVLNYTRN